MYGLCRRELFSTLMQLCNENEDRFSAGGKNAAFSAELWNMHTFAFGLRVTLNGKIGIPLLECTLNV